VLVCRTISEALSKIGLPAHDVLLDNLQNSPEVRMRLACYSALKEIADAHLSEDLTQNLVEFCAEEISILYSRTKEEVTHFPAPPSGSTIEAGREVSWAALYGYERTEITITPDPDEFGIVMITASIPDQLREPIRSRCTKMDKEYFDISSWLKY
jgi:hypothetical protein